MGQDTMDLTVIPGHRMAASTLRHLVTICLMAITPGMGHTRTLTHRLSANAHRRRRHRPLAHLLHSTEARLMDHLLTDRLPMTDLAASRTIPMARPSTSVWATTDPSTTSRRKVTG